MSQALATARAAEHFQSAATTSPLPQPVAEPSFLTRIRPLVVVVGTALILVVVQMGLSIVLDHGAFALSKLQTTQNQLLRNQQAAAERLAVNEAPQTIAKAALSYGMTTAQAPMFLNLKDCAVVGTTKVPKGAKQYQPIEQNLVGNAAQTVVDGSARPVVPAAQTLAQLARQKAVQAEASVLATGAQGGVSPVSQRVTSPSVMDGAEAAAVGAPTWQTSAESVQ